MIGYPTVNASETFVRKLSILWLISQWLLQGLASAQALHTATDNFSGESREGSKVTQAGVSDATSGNFTTGMPFKNPPIISSKNGRLDLRLTAAKKTVSISGKNVGARVYAISSGNQSYDYSFMPPILSIDPGDTVIATLVNKLGESTNLHTHGFTVSPTGNQDNIFVDLENGKPFTYNYTVPPDMPYGSYWFHPHYHGSTEEQVFGGLSGLIYVRGIEQLLPAELRRIEHKFMGLKDLQLTRQNTILADDIDSNAATTRTINGQIQPVIRMHPGETQMWHIGNISADIFYSLSAPGLSLTIIDEDGNPYNQPLTTQSLYMPPGKRFDVLVQAPTAGHYSLVTEAISTGPAGDNYPYTLMATVLVEGSPVNLTPIPSQLGTLDDLSKAKVAQSRIFDLSENQDTDEFFLNHRQFDPNHVDATPKTYTVEEWTIKNHAPEIHPIHVHVNDMQVMSVNGVPQTARSHVDTYAVPSAAMDASGALRPGEIVVRIRFMDLVGPYPLHCHILAHEDKGMMGVINVTSPGSE